MRATGWATAQLWYRETSNGKGCRLNVESGPGSQLNHPVTARPKSDSPLFYPFSFPLV